MCRTGNEVGEQKPDAGQRSPDNAWFRCLRYALLHSGSPYSAHRRPKSVSQLAPRRSIQGVTENEVGEQKPDAGQRSPDNAWFRCLRSALLHSGSPYSAHRRPESVFQPRSPPDHPCVERETRWENRNRTPDNGVRITRGSGVFDLRCCILGRRTPLTGVRNPFSNLVPRQTIHVSNGKRGGRTETGRRTTESG